MLQEDMFFWIFMVCINLLIPLVMAGFGYLFQRKAPKEINEIFGYRTTMSMKNRNTWDFAHHYAGRLWLYMGCGLIPITLTFMWLVYGKDVDTVGLYSLAVLFFQLIPLCGVILPTEYALRKRFDQHGNVK